MISDFITVDKKTGIPLYQQIYDKLKIAIENGDIRENERIPSVRKLCSDLGVSKTTVETAYNLLCSEGYIINLPQKGYYVEKGLIIKNRISSLTSENKPQKTVFRYDFSGKGIDKNCSNISQWRKYVKDILNKEYLLNSYSENQGEEALRRAVAKYAFETRGASADYRNVVIGSGSQTLIYILCGMLGIEKTAAIEKNTFPQAEQVFRDFDYDIKYTESDSKGITPFSIDRIRPEVLLLNPNYNSINGLGMPVTRKLELIKRAQSEGFLIIEDDYNGELRYKTHAKACIQSYFPEQCVYIGSFSKILMPSVRISYMLLPDILMERYEKLRENYNQTTSKVEQLALARYITDGKLEKHLRKSRRYYKKKSELMQDSVKKYFDSFILNETSMYFKIKLPCPVLNLVQKLKDSGIRVMRTSTDDSLNLNFSQIDSELIDEGLREIKRIIEENR